mmetsp:Transcript_4998/g.16679  ORF Transcript_4998/g.16679 Transcript_4998/m.16679 type:complete len:210 (-) Transcript_4998:2671-3300(-)
MPWRRCARSASTQRPQRGLPRRKKTRRTPRTPETLPLETRWFPRVLGLEARRASWRGWRSRELVRERNRAKPRSVAPLWSAPSRCAPRTSRPSLKRKRRVVCERRVVLSAQRVKTQSPPRTSRWISSPLCWRVTALRRLNSWSAAASKRFARFSPARICPRTKPGAPQSRRGSRASHTPPPRRCPPTRWARSWIASWTLSQSPSRYPCA